MPLDINRVELTGEINGQPQYRLVPPGVFFAEFLLQVWQEWPDGDGENKLYVHDVPCFSQGPSAEKLLWLRPNQQVRVFGAIDWIAGNIDGKDVQVVMAVRVREVIPEMAFQQMQEVSDEQQ